MLHPEARAALAEAAERAVHLCPGREGFDLARARAEQQAGAGGGEDVADVSDVELGGVRCRLFRPASGVPVCLYLHGGGWTFGSVAEAEPLCRSVANRAGWAVLSVDYRLAPEAPYPAALEDVERVVAALPARAAELGVDAAVVAVAGDSAGANLGAAVSLRARDAGRSPFRLQVLIYPVLDLVDEAPSRLEFAEDFGLDREAARWHIDCYTPDPADRRRPDVSPLRAETVAGLPAALVVTAEYDPLRDEGEAFAARLAEAGVPVVATRYAGMIHGFADPTRFRAAEAVVDQIAGALRRTGSTGPLTPTRQGTVTV